MCIGGYHLLHIFIQLHVNRWISSTAYIYTAVCLCLGITYLDGFSAEKQAVITGIKICQAVIVKIMCMFDMSYLNKIRHVWPYILFSVKRCATYKQGYWYLGPIVLSPD